MAVQPSPGPRDRPPIRVESAEMEHDRNPDPAPARMSSWPSYTVAALGAWLLASPSALDYSAAMAWSDGISGGILILLGIMALSRWSGYARWGMGAVGGWLLLAPLVFWTREPATYLNDTLVGALVIVFALIVTGAPGEAEDSGPDVPPDWSYNPSAWYQRAPIVAVTFISFLVARHLASYQLGHISSPWEPFFGNGTRRILESDVSRAFPVSDAGLGAVSYLAEALSGCIGGTRRWRTMPWMVMLFGVMVVPLGVVSIVLIMLQPLAVGAWCTLCLVTAALMLVMIAPAMDEMIAAGQYLLKARREGRSAWTTFWKGGRALGGAETEPKESIGAKEVASAMDLTNVPWNLPLAAIVGIWMMAAPSVLDYGGAAAANAYIFAPLVVTFSVIAIGEVARPARLLNVLFGAWLAVSPWLVSGATAVAGWNGVVCGVAIMLLSIPRGKVAQKFGGWNRLLV